MQRTGNKSILTGEQCKKQGTCLFQIKRGLKRVCQQQEMKMEETLKIDEILLQAYNTPKNKII